MELNLDWAKDPIVQLEDEILPSLWLPVDFILQKDGSDDLSILSPKMDRAADLLRSHGKEYLEPAGAAVDAERYKTCAAAADAVEKVHAAVKTFARGSSDDQSAKDLMQMVQNDMRPLVLEVIDVFRETFLTMVLTRQHKHANMSEHSIAELDVISKKIFFVAINASVEAARVGDMGAGFAHISTEIRSLSQSAQAAIQNMRMGKS
ncbi:methyl-accepting chemotaxis protein [uncultured Roseobacter sp.]|uniref:methyl-accepting chemotaxis protein n=1 Tax=uncultured Roseobacter sp. TaxID=114847 RepID=UPI002624D05E|nr:methyl-accepting chemotaxis protein [uncultured Roseobacter sp.]